MCKANPPLGERGVSSLKGGHIVCFVSARRGLFSSYELWRFEELGIESELSVETVWKPVLMRSKNTRH